MSLATNEYVSMAEATRETNDPQTAMDLHMLDRYLAVLEDNKQACRFILDDAALAMDMAGFVQNRLGRGWERPANSAARLSLALIHTEPQGPVQ